MEAHRITAVEVGGIVITVLFVWIGLAMAHDPPAAADAAVGKGLLALAVATAIATFCLAVDRVEREAAARRANAPKTPLTYRDIEGA